MTQWIIKLGNETKATSSGNDITYTFPENQETTDKVYSITCTSDTSCTAETSYTVPGKTVDCSSYGWTAQSPTIAYDYTGTYLVAYTDGFSSLPTWDGNPSWAHHPFIVQGQPGNPLIINAFDANPGPGSRTETAKFTTAEGCEFTTTITQTAPPCGHFTYEFIGDKQQTDTLDLTWDGSTGTTGHTSDHYVITGTCYDCEGNYVTPLVSNSKSGYPYWKRTIENTGGINYKIEIWFDGKYDRESVNNVFTIKNPNSTENMLTFTPTVTKPTISIDWYTDWRDQETAQTRTLFYFVARVERNITPDVATGCNAKIYVNVRSDGSIPCTECTGYGPDEGWDNYCFSGYKEIAFAVNEQACSVRQVPWKCYTQQGYQTACYPATSYSSVVCDGWTETKEVETLAFKYLFLKG